MTLNLLFCFSVFEKGDQIYFNILDWVSGLLVVFVIFILFGFVFWFCLFFFKFLSAYFESELSENATPS